MSLHSPPIRPFEPGTTGWTVDDLEDPEISWLWQEGHYEIVEGVLTLMPAAYLDGSLSIRKLLRFVEDHDRTTKRAWYAEFGVQGYWILDASKRSLECLILEKGAYRIDVEGTGDQTLKPQVLPSLSIPLSELWL